MFGGLSFGVVYISISPVVSPTAAQCLRELQCLERGSLVDTGSTVAYHQMVNLYEWHYKCVSEAISPVSEAISPVTEAISPVSEAISPVTEAISPVSEAISPVTEAISPVSEAISPVTEAISPVTEAISPYL